MTFETEAQRILEKHECKPRRASELLDLWRFFVDECVDGYGSSIYEFDNDLSVREDIEVLLQADEVVDRQGFETFLSVLKIIDARYAELLQPDVKRPGNIAHWWRTGVLRYAGDEYCSDANDLYSIQVRKLE